MTEQEYMDRCLTIPYKRNSLITTFGEPMNCYVFIYWFYKLVLDIELENNNVNSFADIKSINYKKVEYPQNYDIIDVNTFSKDTHVALYYNGYMYHYTRSGLQVKNVKRIPNLIRGYYRVS